jgi:hypothetical protein
MSYWGFDQLTRRYCWIRCDDVGRLREFYKLRFCLINQAALICLWPLETLPDIGS